ncbi:MAG: AsmA family protein [Thiotrichales bacterium]
MKVIKWILIILLLLILLLVGGAIAVATFIDPNDYKLQISEQVKKATGRDLDIAGDISWSFFPWLGLNLGKTTFSNAPGFGDEPFAAIDEVDIHVAIPPLLKKQVEAKKIRVVGASLNLEKNKAGKTNWEDLSKPAESTPTEEPQTQGSGSTPDIEINIAGVELTRAKLRYQDAQAGSTIIVNPLNLKTGRIALGKPIPLSADLALDQDGNQIEAKLSATVTADPKVGTYRIDQLKLTNNIKADGLPADGLKTEASLNLDANTTAQTLAVKDLVIKALGIELAGDIHVTQLKNAPGYQGQFSTNTFSPRSIFTEMEIAAPATQDESVLSKAALKFRVSGNTKKASLTDLKATLDDSTLTGHFTIADIAAMALRFDLTLDQINIDRYLPPVGEAPQTEEQAAVAADEIILPVDVLRSLNIGGTARVNELIASKLKFENASVTLKAKGGKLDIAPLKADLYQGAANIFAGLDVTSDMPRYSTKIDLAGVRSEDILETLFGDRYISGVANFKGNLATSGSRVSTMKSSLNGNMNANFKDGTIKGSKLSRKINEARNVLRKFQGKTELSEEINEETKFSYMGFSALIKNGVLTNEDLKIESPVFVANGKGRVDLPGSFVDYTLGLALPGETEKAYKFLPLRIKGSFDDLAFKLEADQMLKLRLKEEKEKAKQKLEAEKAKLKARADAEKAKAEAELKAKADAEKAKLQEKLDAEKDKLKENLENQLQEGLKGLFK